MTTSEKTTRVLLIVVLCCTFALVLYLSIGALMITFKIYQGAYLHSLVSRIIQTTFLLIANIATATLFGYWILIIARGSNE